MTAKRFLIFVCACSMAMLLWPSDALAQRGGGGGGRGGGGGGPAPAGRGGGPGPSGGHGGYPSGQHGGYQGGGYGYRGAYYRPAYGYRPYYGYYRPFYYSPYFYNGFYASFAFGVGWGYPYYGYGWGYPYYGSYGGYPYYSGYGYPYGPYPSPAYAYAPWSSARVEVKPRDAQVFVDGNFVGVVDSFDGVFQRLDVPAGEHEIAIYSPGYHTYTERTLFRPGQSYHFKTDLQPLPPGAPSEPKPVPQPRSSGNGPDQNQPGYGGDPNQPDPYGGQQPPGYGQPPPPGYGRTQPPPDRSGERNRVEVGGGFATLSLRVQPGDASVQIDGERWDSPEGGSRLIVQLAAGQHRIEVRKDGFRPYSTTITIRPGEPQSLNVVLPPQQEASLRGTMQH